MNVESQRRGGRAVLVSVGGQCSRNWTGVCFPAGKAALRRTAVCSLVGRLMVRRRAGGERRHFRPVKKLTW